MIRITRKILGYLFHSIFTKLLVILFLSWCVMTIIVWGTFRHHAMKPHEGPYIKNLDLYIQFLTDEIGFPPNIEKAKGIAEKTNLIIQYKNNEMRWSTSDQLEEIEPEKIDTFYEDERMLIGKYRRWFLLKPRLSHGDLYFFAQRGFLNDTETHIYYALFMFTLLTIILFLMFFAMRWVLKPVKWLSQAVMSVGEGNLDPVIPTGRKDELGSLSQAFMDMTERIKQMLKSRNQLLLDVSHELRSPLTRIKVALEFMEDSSTKKSIRDDVAELMTMVTEILENARLNHTSHQLNLEETDLSLLLKNAVKLFKKDKPFIQLSDDLAPCPFKVDVNRIGIVLSNILTNALKYSDKNGPPVKVTLILKDNAPVITVTDHGAGIPESELPHIFEPFYRVDKSRSKKTGGYGLGLGLVKSIMEAHGGTVDIESNLGKGTTVILGFKKRR